VSALLEPASRGDTTSHHDLAETLVGYGAVWPGHSLESERLVEQQHGDLS
jgi:hypothetical protein